MLIENLYMQEKFFQVEENYIQLNFLYASKLSKLHNKALIHMCNKE